MKFKLRNSALLLLASAPAFAGPLLLVDTNTTLYKVDSAGNASVFNTSSAFTQARGLAVGPDGNYYVADLSAGKVDKVDSVTGAVSTFATVANAYGLAWNGNQLFVSTFNAGGNILTFDAAGTSVGAFSTGFSNLTDLAFSSTGSLFVSSGGAHGVLAVDLVNSTASLFADTSAQGAFFNGNSISTPRGIAFEGTDMFVTDSGACSGACGGSGNNLTAFNATTGAYDSTLAGNLGGAKGLIYDGASSAFYFASSLGDGIHSSDLSGNVSTYSLISGTQDLVSLSSATPEPGTAMLMFGAMSAVVYRFRRRKV